MTKLSAMLCRTITLRRFRESGAIEPVDVPSVDIKQGERGKPLRYLQPKSW